MKKKTPISRDPSTQGFSYDEFFNNKLSLPETLKKQLKAEGLDWRFINSIQFRQSGGVHRSHWQPYKISNPEELGLALSPEGFLHRGDLILAVRKKEVSAAHKQFLNERNRRYSGYNKQQARELKQMAREQGVGENVDVFEGYDEN